MLASLSVAHHVLLQATHQVSRSEARKFGETDLAWRAIDRGWDILYEPRLVLQHPRTSPARHAVHHRMTARNRVWPAPAAPDAPADGLATDPAGPIPVVQSRCAVRWVSRWTWRSRPAPTAYPRACI